MEGKTGVESKIVVKLKEAAHKGQPLSKKVIF